QRTTSTVSAITSGPLAVNPPSLVAGLQAGNASIAATGSAATMLPVNQDSSIGIAWAATVGRNSSPVIAGFDRGERQVLPQLLDQVPSGGFGRNRQPVSQPAPSGMGQAFQEDSSDESQRPVAPSQMAADEPQQQLMEAKDISSAVLDSYFECDS